MGASHSTNVNNHPHSRNASNHPLTNSNSTSSRHSASSSDRLSVSNLRSQLTTIYRNQEEEEVSPLLEILICLV